MSHDGQFQRHDIFIVNLSMSASLAADHSRYGTYPVLCRTPYKSVLTATSRSVSFDGVSSCSNQIKQFRQLNDELIIIHPIEWMGFKEVFVECGFERESCQFLESISTSGKEYSGE